MRLAIPRLAETFAYHRFYYNSESKDLYFVGIKRGADAVDTPPDYVAPSVVPDPRAGPTVSCSIY